MTELSLAIFGPVFATALVALAAAYGISRIGTASVEGMARQPEASGAIRTGMIIAAAFIEGVAFFSVIVCLIGVNGIIDALKLVVKNGGP